MTTNTAPRNPRIVTHGVDWEVSRTSDNGPSIAGPSWFIDDVVTQLRQAVVGTDYTVEAICVDHGVSDNVAWRTRLRDARTYSIVRCYVAEPEIIRSDPMLMALVPDEIRDDLSVAPS